MSAGQIEEFKAAMKLRPNNKETIAERQEVKKCPLCSKVVS